MQMQFVARVTELLKFKSKAKTRTVCSEAVVLMSEVVVKHFDLFELLDRVLVKNPRVVVVLLLKNQPKLVDERRFDSVSIDDEADACTVSGATFFLADSGQWVAVVSLWLVIVAMLREEVQRVGPNHISQRACDVCKLEEIRRVAVPFAAQLPVDATQMGHGVEGVGFIEERLRVRNFDVGILA